MVFYFDASLPSKIKRLCKEKFSIDLFVFNLDKQLQIKLLLSRVAK